MDAHVFIVHDFPKFSRFLESLEATVMEDPPILITVLGRYGSHVDIVNYDDVTREMSLRVTSVANRREPKSFYVTGVGGGGYVSGYVDYATGEGQLVVSNTPLTPPRNPDS